MYSELKYWTTFQAIELIRAGVIINVGDGITWHEGPNEIRGKISAFSLSGDCLHLTVDDVCHKRTYELEATPDVGLGFSLNPALQNLLFARDDSGNVFIFERKSGKESVYQVSRKKA